VNLEYRIVKNYTEEDPVGWLTVEPRVLDLHTGIEEVSAPYMLVTIDGQAKRITFVTIMFSSVFVDEGGRTFCYFRAVDNSGKVYEIKLTP
jgi:hypothetical protein